MYTPTPHEEALARAVVNSAFAVHKFLGPGLLESVYERCLCCELKARSIPYKRQVLLPLIYDGVKIAEGLRLDLLIDDRLICELKSVEALTPIYLAQVLTQLRLADLHLGFLINFNVERIKDGIRRIIRS
jgi:GxxExxY protein